MEHIPFVTSLPITPDHANHHHVSYLVEKQYQIPEIEKVANIQDSA
jgi:hypothetical protein